MAKLYIHNDDIHSFNDVILILSNMFDYPLNQCASIAQIIHTTGNCCVKEGGYTELFDYQNKLNYLKFETEIQNGRRKGAKK